MKVELPQLVEIYIALLTRLKTSTAQEAQQEGRIIYHLSCNRRVIARARSYDYILPRGSDFDFSVALIADLV